MTAADFDRALAAARRTSPDLLTVDDKCDVLWGPADEPTRAWEAASVAEFAESLLLIGSTDCGQVTW